MKRQIRIAAVILIAVVLQGGYLFAGEQSRAIPRYKTKTARKDHPGFWKGCSLGCAMGWTMSASSHLKSSGRNTYFADNGSDTNPDTCWAEGADGEGLGQWLEFHLKDHPNRQNTETTLWGFYFLNGYKKSLRLWQANNRVKELRMDLNGKPICYFELVDSPIVQMVGFPCVNVKAGDRLRLTITGVYRGTLYNDTCISEARPRGAH